MLISCYSAGSLLLHDCLLTISLFCFFFGDPTTSPETTDGLCLYNVVQGVVLSIPVISLKQIMSGSEHIETQPDAKFVSSLPCFAAAVQACKINALLSLQSRPTELLRLLTGVPQRVWVEVVTLLQGVEGEICQEIMRRLSGLIS